MEEHVQPGTRRRTIAVAIGASLLLVLFVAGLTFANSIGASRVAENAGSLQWANAALGTSSLTRAALVQATTIVEMEARGLATTQDVGFAMEQVANSHDFLAQLHEDGESSPSHAVLTHYLADTTIVRDALADGDHGAATVALTGDVEQSYIDLVDSLQTDLDAIQEAINDNTATARSVNGYVVFILTLAIPASAVLVYWWIARRQVREHQIKTEVELEAERAVSRAKDSFIAGLSHELRTPLTSIYGFAEILTDRVDHKQTAELAQIIANEASEMTRMVDDLLAASRMESTGIEIEMNPTRVRDIVESAITPFERAGLTIKRASTDAMVVTDGARLRHVIVNLLSNAARHGGPLVGIEVSPGDETVDIEVWDTGPGVSDDQLENLFDRFIHNGAQPLLTGSVGLGLAVASRLTGLLDGRLAYQRFGGKTYFIVSVPVYAAEGDEANGGNVAEVIKAMSA